jgi:archaellum component FlaG (FlaF/FlaG flagellin family)
MTKLIAICSVICLISTAVFALPVDKNLTQEKNAVSESAQQLIQVVSSNNQIEIISANICLGGHENTDLISSLVCGGYSTIEKSPNHVSIDIDGKIVTPTNNRTASLVNNGNIQPSWLK